MNQIVILGLVLPVMFLTANSFAQSDRSIDEQIVDVKITLERKDPICMLGGIQNLEYGTLQAPTSGIGTASFDPAVKGGKLMYEDNSGNPLTSRGNPIIGTMFMRTGLWTERIHPEIFELNEEVVLRRCDGDSDTSGGRCWISYSLAIGASCEKSADNWVRQGIGRLPKCTGIPRTVYFQIGGDVIVPEKTPAGTYEGTLNAMLTCE